MLNRIKVKVLVALFMLVLVLGASIVATTGTASAHSNVATQHTVAGIPTDCTPYVTGKTVAWGGGGWLYLNQCALDRIQTIAGGNITAGAAMIITYRYPQAGLFIGAVYIYFGTMQAFSSACNGRGVFLLRANLYVWPRKVC